jgi:spore maturation protein CgeB
VFIGGCDADRAPYFEHLVRALPHLRIHLYGGYFDRYPALKPYWHGFVTGRDYRLALGGAKIAINLVRRANRDDHVMRTFEVPACGAFMLAERTPTHQGLFQEDREAAFFNSHEELAAKVQHWLEHDTDRVAVASAGQRKILEGRHSYADRLDQILELARPLITNAAAYEGQTNAP